MKSLDELKADLRGSWGAIFDALAPELAEAMAAAPKHVACPVHGGTDGFRLFRDYQDTGGAMCNTCGGFRDGFKLLAWVRGYSMKDAVKDVGTWDRGGTETPAPRVRPAPKPVAPKDTVAAARNIERVLAESQPIAGTPAEAYLVSRGIWANNIPKTLRFHPGLRYYSFEDKKVLGTFPCLLAPITSPAGEVVSVHRIYLTPEGAKAPVPDAKKMMSARAELPGSCIQLFEPGEVLGLAEGIETALAAHAISKMPIWSCVNTALLKGVVLPASIRAVVIWADKDRAPEKGRDLTPPGEAAAKALQERLMAEGRQVEVLYPGQPIPEGAKGIDWLDVLGTLGPAGFPERWR